MAKESYYFSHDSNAITDTKILNMRADYGLEGYGLYWCIIEMMRNEENYMLKIIKNTYRAIKTLSNTTIDIEKYIKDCIEDYQLFKKENEMFFSKSLLNRMDKYENKRRINRENGKLGGRPKKTEEKPNALKKETQKNQNKGNESKENESKINCNYLDDIQEIINFYNINIGEITSFGVEVLTDYVEKLNKDLIILAMKKAVEADKRNLQYIKGILNKWHEKGLKTLLEVQKEEEIFRKSSKKECEKHKKSGYLDYTQRNYDNLDFLYENMKEV